MEGSVQEQLEQMLPVAWQHSKNLGDCMIELYDTRLWTDVKFRCKDHDESERIHAHKIILAARSPVFQAMFFGPCADRKDEVELDNAESKILDLFLRYIYSDTVTLTEENASAVLEMAHYYQVTNLVQFCADYLTTVITTENVCGILTLAMFYKVTTLRDACCTCIDRNAEEILLSEEFLKLPVECLTYVLKGDTFYVDEDEIFNKAEEWSKRQIGEGYPEMTGPIIRKTLGASFYYLRLPTMTSQTFMACTRKKGYFSLEEHEDIVDFINKAPAASSVKSNSCVARIPPKEETLTVNNLDGEINVSDNITTIFQISVSRDVKLTNVVVTGIQKHLKYDTELYSAENCPTVYVGEPDLNTFFRQNNEKLLKLTYTVECRQETRHRRNRSYYNYYNYETRSAQELKRIHGEDLSDKLNIVTSGTVKLTRQKAKIAHSVESDKVLKLNQEETEAGNGGIQDEVREREVNEESTDGLVYSEDEGNLIFEQDFQLLSSDVAHRRIDLREPLILTKDASPFTVEITMNYGCASEVKMKTICSNTKTVTSKFGQLEIQDIAGQFAGIESIRFENISNR